jgi:Na+-translocating ferredoxin:NAD+ oxidoreductase RnfG subunit
MEIFGVTVSVGELLALITFVGTGFLGWVNVKTASKQNAEDIKELAVKVLAIDIKVNQHEKEVGIVTSSLNSINSQLTGVSTRIDTLINFLLGKDK